jgi:hypothetical protein
MGKGRLEAPAPPRLKDRLPPPEPPLLKEEDGRRFLDRSAIACANNFG